MKNKIITEANQLLAKIIYVKNKKELKELVNILGSMGIYISSSCSVNKPINHNKAINDSMEFIFNSGLDVMALTFNIMSDKKGEINHTLENPVIFYRVRLRSEKKIPKEDHVSWKNYLKDNMIGYRDNYGNLYSLYSFDEIDFYLPEINKNIINKTIKKMKKWE